MSLSCEICFEVYSTESSGRDVTPRTLRECGHTYCTSCCAQLLSDEKIICPSCREITVCKNGINDLPKAFALINLLNDIKLAPAASSATPPSSIPSSSSSNHEKSSVDEKASSDPLDKVDATDTHAGLSITARRSSPSSSSSSSPSPSSDQNDSVDVLLSVRPLLSGSRGRTPLDVCCVVDVSGSMGSEAQIKNDQGQNVSHGLSLLDIVKHAVRTIIRGLGPQDRLSIVSYSSTATTVLGLTAMTETGAKQAETALSALDADGGTNLFDGLKQGLDVLDAAPKSSETSYRTQALLLLSDGLPNISPPQKEMKALRNYFDSHQTLAASCSVHCFGFGYDVDSVLMNNIALEGGGMFVFIPDSSFVGTAFVSTLANLLVTTAGDIRFDIEAINGAEIIKTSKGGSAVLGSHKITSTSWGATVNIGPLQYDQPKDLIAQIRLPSSWSEGTPFIRATLRYHDISLNADESVTVACAKLIDSSSPSSVEVERHLFRSRFIDLIKSIFISESVPHIVEKSSLIQSLSNEFKASAFIKDAQFDGLLQDIEGQVLQAFSRSDWMQRWGRHYIPSLVRAHQLQQSNNFKDPGVQFYGGELFKKLRDEADAIFLKIPPPTPSLPNFISSNYSSSSTGGGRGGGSGIKKKGAPRSAINMSAYHNRNNACFAPWSLISLSDGTLRTVSELKKGDRVKVYCGPSFDQVKESSIRCIVRSQCADHREYFVRLTETMAITCYHPVYDQQSKSFAFPRDLMQIEELECDSVYSILLTEGEESGLIELGGSIKAVTLGHQLRGSSVIEHPFFGSRSVIDALRNRKGFEEGRVELSESSCSRHPITGLVNGFRE